MGVETGGCPHTAIREDASINLAAIDEMRRRFPALDLILIESGGDNLAATFSPELADLTIYVIDVSGGEKIPRKGGPGVTRSDLLVINKIDLAPYVGASLEVMARDAALDAQGAPLRHGQHEDRRGRRDGDRVHSRQGRAGWETVMSYLGGRDSLSRHGRACPGHPRLLRRHLNLFFQNKALRSRRGWPGQARP